MEVAKEVLAAEQTNMHGAEACAELDVDSGDSPLQGRIGLVVAADTSACDDLALPAALQVDAENLRPVFGEAGRRLEEAGEP
jgi:hypothetical protein